MNEKAELREQVQGLKDTNKDLSSKIEDLEKQLKVFPLIKRQVGLEIFFNLIVKKF
jgi:hypothetical protein